MQIQRTNANHAAKALENQADCARNRIQHGQDFMKKVLLNSFRQQYHGNNLRGKQMTRTPTIFGPRNAAKTPESARTVGGNASSAKKCAGPSRRQPERRILRQKCGVLDFVKVNLSEFVATTAVATRVRAIYETSQKITENRRNSTDNRRTNTEKRRASQAIWASLI